MKKKPDTRPVGRPDIGAKRRQVTLPDETIVKARKIGDGNISAGIRKAVARYRSL